MNTTLLFFLIGFAAALIGFAVGYFSGDKLAQREYDENPELQSLLTQAANSKTVHRPAGR